MSHTSYASNKLSFHHRNLSAFRDNTEEDIITIELYDADKAEGSNYDKSGRSEESDNNSDDDSASNGRSPDKEEDNGEGTGETADREVDGPDNHNDATGEEASVPTEKSTDDMIQEDVPNKNWATASTRTLTPTNQHIRQWRI